MTAELGSVLSGLLGIPGVRGEVTLCTEDVLEPDTSSPRSEAGDSRETLVVSVVSRSEPGSRGAKGCPVLEGVGPGLLRSLESGVSLDGASGKAEETILDGKRVAPGVLELPAVPASAGGVTGALLMV